MSRSFGGLLGRRCLHGRGLASLAFSSTKSELLLLLLLLGRLLSSCLLGLQGLLLSDLLAAKGLTPLIELRCGNLSEEELGLADGLSGLDGVTSPVLGDSDESRGADLGEDVLGGGGHVWVNDASKELEVIYSKTDNGGTAIRLIDEKLVVELAILEELITQSRDVHYGSETGSELDGLKVGDVGLEGLVDLLLVFLETLVGVLGVVGNLAVHLGLAELENSLVQVTKVLEKIVVIGVDEFLPLELGVGRLRSSGKEVVSPNVRVHARLLCGVSKDTNTLGFTELATFVVKVLGS